MWLIVFAFCLCIDFLFHWFLVFDHRFLEISSSFQTFSFLFNIQCAHCSVFVLCLSKSRNIKKVFLSICWKNNNFFLAIIYSFFLLVFGCYSYTHIVNVWEIINNMWKNSVLSVTFLYKWSQSFCNRYCWMSMFVRKIRTYRYTWTTGNTCRTVDITRNNKQKRINYRFINFWRQSIETGKKILKRELIFSLLLYQFFFVFCSLLRMPKAH